MERIYAGFSHEEDKIIRANLREFELLNIFIGSVLNVLVSCRDIMPLEVAGRLKLSMLEYVESLYHKTPISLPLFLNVCRILNLDYSAVIAWFEDYKKTDKAISYLRETLYSSHENGVMHDDVIFWAIPISEEFCRKNSLKQSEIKDNQHD